MQFHLPSTALRGPIGSYTEAPSGTARMRHTCNQFGISTRAVQRFVASSSTEAPSGTARMRPTHRIWHFHPRSFALRGPIGGSTEDPSWTARMRSTRPIWHLHPPSTTLRGPIRSFTKAP
eukprot:8104654-Pyramimonas_sp.AAC.1